MNILYVSPPIAKKIFETEFCRIPVYESFAVPSCAPIDTGMLMSNAFLLLIIDVEK